MVKLLLIESPGKLKKLSQILGPGWLVKASMGHVRELANDGEDALGFDMDGDRIRCRYMIRNDRAQKVLTELRRTIRQADAVYIGTDPDREGETIGWHLQDALHIKHPHRIVYSEITPAAVKQAIAHPRQLNATLVAAGRTRDCLDKLVGYKGSRHVVWPLNNGAKSMGRVQSATLHLLCVREHEIQTFIPQDYWSVWVQYTNCIKAFYCRALDSPSRSGAQESKANSNANSQHRLKDNQLGQKNHIQSSDTEENVLDTDTVDETAKPIVPESARVKSQVEADRLIAIARSHPHTVIKVDGKLTQQSPPPPFITSTLQQAAGQKLRFSPEHTMNVAQRLYEAGHITYMRTDSVALAPPFRHAVQHYLTQNDPTNIPKQTTRYRSAKNAQDAHEAIRPTAVNRTPQAMNNSLGGEQAALYDLIWRRAIASLCCPAHLRKTRIVTQSADIFWEARGQVLEISGYTRYWNNVKADRQLPSVQPGQILTLQTAEAEKKQTQPPPRYTEPKLIQLMERKGIGRPSTYAPTLKTLRSRTYIQIIKGKVWPTALGLELDAALSVLLPDLIQPEFTAQMELALDAIAHGQQDWQTYLTRWHQTYFGPAIAQAKINITSGNISKILRSQHYCPSSSAQLKSPPNPRHQAPSSTESVPTTSGSTAFVPTTSIFTESASTALKHGSPSISSQASKASSPSPPLTRSKTPCPNCKALMSKIPSKSKKMRAKHFLKCLTPGCGSVMFWNGRKKHYELPYAQQPPDPTKFTDHPCPVCGAWLERYPYTKDGTTKELLRCSLFENRKGKCKEVAYFQTHQGFWSPKFGNL